MALKALLRAVGIGAALMTLSGCLQANGQGGDLFAVVSTVSRPVGEPLPQAPIAGGELLIRGPEGYCVDARSLSNQASGGFALLASCFVMTGGKQGIPVAPVVMTVSASRLGGAGVPDPAALARAFAPAPVLAQTRAKGVSLVHLGTGGEGAVPHADPKHWRGALEINGHLVLLAVYASEGSYEASRGGSALVIELAQALRAAKSRPVAKAPASPAPGTAAKGGGLLGGLLQ